MRLSVFAALFGSTLLGSATIVASAETWPYCDSQIFCHGNILKAVQLANLYPDSKTFVDKPTKKPLQQVIDSFNSLGANPSNSALQSWVDDNFNPEGLELVQATLPDFKEHVSFTKHISDPELRGFGQAVHGYWASLSRTVNKTGLCDGCVSSFIPVNHTFIVPGGRFRELYYWDTYFILQGVLVSELYDTAKSIIQNFLDLVEKFGFMPNGGRIYYLNRSQPPFLTQMVKIYYEKTKDNELLDQALPILEKELNFWYQNTTITVKNGGQSYKLNHYNVQNLEPRPESYFEDYNTVNNGTHYTDAEKASLYADLATGAETGWDYSSRWLKDPLATDLRSLNTRAVVPVDLNSLLYANEVAIANFYKLRKGDVKKSHEYIQRSEDRRKAMQDLMWDDKENSFYDFNVTSGKRSTEFSLSNYYPFWLGALPDNVRSNTEKLEASFDQIKDILKKYPGVLPTTLINTGQQWDFPNGWPPLQFILMNALIEIDSAIKSQTHHHRAKRSGSYTGSLLSAAKDLARRFTDSAFCGWVGTGGSIPGILPKQANTNDTGHIFEKYNVTTLGLPGGGGEYTVQTGFGWTNGVILWTLNKFGEDLKAINCNITS